MKNTLLACGYEFWEHRRTQLLRFGVLVGFFLLINALICISECDDISSGYPPSINSITDSVRIAFIVNMLLVLLTLNISASMMFGSLSKPTSCIRYLMFPLTMKEKFLGQWIFYIGGATIATLFVSFFFQWLSLTIICAGQSFGVLNIVIRGILTVHPMMFATIFLALLFTSSFFALGSIFFRRYSFLLTAVLLYIGQMAIGLLVAYVPAMLTLHDLSITPTGLKCLHWLFLAVMIAFTIFNWRMTAQRFYETDIR